MDEPRVNERGNTVVSDFLLYADRYKFDFQECTSANGWEQWDTEQDASYFGVWVHRERREIVTYCEGDVTRIICPTTESFKAEIASMEEFYGPVPYCAVAIDAEGKVTKYYDDRLKVEDL